MMKKLFPRFLSAVLCVCMLCGLTPAMASILMITQQPKDIAVPEGDVAVVSVTVRGEGIQYEWWYAPADTNVFTKVEDHAASSMEVTMDAAHHGMKMYCIVSDAYNHVAQTKTATLYMMTPLEITLQPQDAYAYEGESFDLLVQATGDELTYAWWFANADSEEFSLSSQVEAEYTLEMTQSRDNRRMYCVVTDKYGRSVQTDTVTLIMKAPLVIANQPAHASAAVGESVAFTVEAQGDQVSYIWWMADENGEMQKTDCTDAQLNVVLDESCDGRTVYCVVTDEYGITAQTETVTMSLIPAGLVYEIREGNAVVTGYTAAESALVIPATIEGCPVTEIAANAFEGNDTLVSITLPEKLQVVGENAFAACAGLKSIVVADAMQLEEGWLPVLIRRM